MILSDIGSRMCRVVRTIYVPLHRCTRHVYQRIVRAIERRKLQNDSIPLMSRWDKLPYIDEAVIVCDGELDLSLSDSDNDSVSLLTDVHTEHRHSLQDTQADSTSLSSIDEPDIPVSLGVFLTISCVLLLSEYYRHIEDYGPAESVYYSLLTYVAGDFVPTKFEFAAPVYILIFLGFSMLSLTISIVQNNIENLMKRVRREVQREIIKQMEKSADGDGGTQKTPEEIMSEIMKKHGGGAFMQNMVISQRQIENLHDFADNAARQANAYAQTDPDPDDRPPPILANKGTTCIVRVQHRECNTVRHPHTHAATNARPDTCDLWSQASPLLSDAIVSAHILPDQLKATQTFIPTRGSTVQANPDMADKETNQLVSVTDQSVVVKPKTRTVAIQFPRLAAASTQPWRNF